VRGLLAASYEKPPEIDAPPGSYDTDAVRTQTRLTQKTGAEAARRALACVPVTSLATAGPEEG
jgi:hypothetical protein